LAVIMVFPFYWMLISSVKTIDEYYLTIPTFWPQNFQFSNYIDAWTKADFGRYMINTVLVGLTSTLVSLFITILAAFAFAKLKFKGREVLFSILLATMMIPGEMFTITNYQTVSNWNWKNSYTVLIVPFLVSVFYIYLLRQNFKQIPDSLYYAAKVDGCSDMKYLFRVLVPLSMPSIITITILKMMGAWNSYIWPRLVTTTDAYKLVTNGLRTAFNDEASGRINYPLQMAAVVIVSLPLFIIFVIFRKYIMRGVSRSGTKG
ncbi:MAG: carbohydrate ABC transporter permease, partial [Acholeplasmatales bacterium]|nr:carbohydrate ABC transporter permease [Acholeplasmatales bacterium]